MTAPRVGRVDLELLMPGIHFLLSNPSGPVARNMLAVGHRVEAGAKRRARVNTGRMRSSIQALMVPFAGAWEVQITTGVRYAEFVERGTGIYGPYRQRITPRHGRYLVFTIGSRRIFVRSTRGMRARPFLRPALVEQLNSMQ